MSFRERQHVASMLLVAADGLTGAIREADSRMYRDKLVTGLDG